MLLDNIKFNLENLEEHTCYRVGDKTVTYGKLNSIVKQIYCYLIENKIEGKVICYGHKQIEMIATFLACSFAGITYIPVDSSTPLERLKYIISSSKSNVIFNYTEDDYNFDLIRVINKNDQIQIFSKNIENITIDIRIKREDIYYIIYTSGSTGEPKGVQVTYSNINSFINWFSKKINMRNVNVLNQAAFSFDLSVADLYFSLFTGSTINIIDTAAKFDFKELYLNVKNSEVELAVMTPSFADVLLLDDKFNEKYIKKLNTIYFCGEVLPKKTVDRLKKRFKNIRIINSYGPTECTVAVSMIDVENISEEVLPVGYIKDDINVYVVDSNLEILQDEKKGEILIVGNSVSNGYINKSSEKFIEYNGKKAYLTGDIGYIKDNKLYFVGRIDNQIKYLGYRIDINDITNNLYKLDYVEKASTYIKKDNENIVKNIISFVKLKDNINDINSLKVRHDLKEYLPSYMIPKVNIVDRFELNTNGKVDNKKMEELLNGRENN